MNFLANYGLFLAKLASVVIAILVILITIASIKAKGKQGSKGTLKITNLNNRYKAYSQTVAKALNDKNVIKALKKKEKKAEKLAASKNKKSRLFVLNFDGDIRASRTEALREEITALLLVATTHDEVVVRLESGGGLVNAYGLAASQLKRIVDAKIKLTVAIDKIAASGGYMMACVADHIIAAPFAIVGSIGVVAQLPNFHRLLKEKSIDFEQITAGEYKRTLTVFGENTEKGREKFQEDINETHALFKQFIHSNRSQIDLQKVATGEHWFANQTMDLKLVDDLQPSDDYLLAASKQHDVFEVEYQVRKTLAKRLSSTASILLHKLAAGKTQQSGQDYL